MEEKLLNYFKRLLLRGLLRNTFNGFYNKNGLECQKLVQKIKNEFKKLKMRVKIQFKQSKINSNVKKCQKLVKKVKNEFEE